MTDSLSYSLRLDARTSDAYYATIAAFANQWLAHTQGAAGDLLNDFQAFRRTAGLPERPFEEDAFELLVLGVLLREHGSQAAGLPAWPAWLLTRLVEFQNRWPWAEGAMKALRGLAGGLLNGSRSNERSSTATAENIRTKAAHLPPAQAAVSRLLIWLQAQGQTTQAGRLAVWPGYFEAIGPQRAEQVMRQSLALADDFARESAASLGEYTAEVEQFRCAAAAQVRFRYDAELVLRTRLEYHLGMLGTELLNRAYRARFLAAPVKIVIAPPCLRAQPDPAQPGQRCQAIQTPLGARCQGCRPDCRLHQLTKLGEKAGVAVYSIPDDELKKMCLASGQAGGRVGVVGLSCALTNWNAGWEADRLGLPAQGLLLDHASCSKHWRRPGLPTDTNFAKLQELIEVNPQEYEAPPVRRLAAAVVK